MKRTMTMVLMAMQAVAVSAVAQEATKEPAKEAAKVGVAPSPSPPSPPATATATPPAAAPSSAPAPDALTAAPPSAAPPSAAPGLTPEMIRKAVRETLAEDVPPLSPASGAAFSGGAMRNRLSVAFEQAKVPDCLHDGAMKHQPAHIGPFAVVGPYALPWYLAAVLRGKCR